jgi:nucleotide-binding universal stress UspA family protein
MKAKRSKHRGEVVLELDKGDESLLAAGAGRAATLFRLKKILVPIDFSDCSKKALQYAIPLARQHGAALTLLYVVPQPSFVGGEYTGIEYARLEDDQAVSGKKQLGALIANEVQGEVPAETLVRSGMPVVEILEAAKALPADLIVISTHGRTGLKHVLLGSVAEDVVRRAPCPVLVVREHEHDFVGS